MKFGLLSLVSLSLIHQAYAGGLVVHEWGTFTSVQGSNGENVAGLEYEEEALPRFVHNREPLIEKLADALGGAEGPFGCPVGCFQCCKGMCCGDLLSRSGKQRMVTDGPFAETKEQLLGFFVIDVADLDEALAVAKELHAANPTSVYELRPIALYAPEDRADAPKARVKVY